MLKRTFQRWKKKSQNTKSLQQQKEGTPPSEDTQQKAEDSGLIVLYDLHALS